MYSWSIGHILEHEFFCLGLLGSSGSKEKKVDLSYFEQLLRVVFFNFEGENVSTFLDLFWPTPIRPAKIKYLRKY